MPVQKQACNTGSSEIMALNSLDIDPHVQLLTMIRDPIEHELSMFVKRQDKLVKDFMATCQDAHSTGVHLILMGW